MIKGTLRDPQKDSYKINVNMTSEIKSWFLRLLRLVLDASRLVSSPLCLWGAGWIVRFDWVVCGEKMSGKKIWLIEWERPVRVILASSPATAESRASEQSKAHIFKTNHFFRVTFSVSNYYLLKRNSWCFQCLHITYITALHSGIDFYIYCCWWGKPLLKCVVSKW